MTDGRESAYPCNYELDSEGLTKRELFAAMAMQAIVAKVPLHDKEGEYGLQSDDAKNWAIRHAIAESAVNQADALIEALNEGEAKP